MGQSDVFGTSLLSDGNDADGNQQLQRVTLDAPLMMVERVNKPDRVTDIERARVLLAAEAEGLSDDQVAELIRQADVVALCLMETFVAQRSKSAGGRQDS